MRVDNNFSTVPAFKSVNSIKCWGLYKKHPEMAKELVDAFQSNPNAINFSKKYDVDIILSSYLEEIREVTSRVAIFYKEIRTGKLQKFWANFLGSAGSIEIKQAGREFWNPNEALASSTKRLKDMILPADAKTDCELNGELDSRLNDADKQIQDFLNKKREKKISKESKSKADKESAAKLRFDKKELKKSISELINNTK